MSRVFNGEVHVSYGQFYLVWDAYDGAQLPDCFRGQINGLCGAAEPYNLTLMTGLHTGGVRFSLDLCQATPPLEPMWEEAVEVSCTIDAQEAVVCTLDGGVCDISLSPGTYRARYSACQMDEGSEKDTYIEGEAVDFYHLALWPATLAPDVIVKQTSKSAAYWHEYAKSLQD